MRLVDLYLERGDRASAIGALRKALDVAPNLLDAQAKQIEFSRRKKRFKEALACQEDPSAPDGRNRVPA